MLEGPGYKNHMLRECFLQANSLTQPSTSSQLGPAPTTAISPWASALEHKARVPAPVRARGMQKRNINMA